MTVIPKTPTEQVQTAPDFVYVQQIKSLTDRVEAAKKEKRRLNDSLNRILLEDQDFKELDAQIDNLKVRIADQKKKIIARNTVAKDIVDQIDTQNLEARSCQLSISDYLQGFVEKTHKNTLDGKKILVNYKLK